MHQGLNYVHLALTYFWSIFSFYNPRKHQKTKGLQVFSGNTKWENWIKNRLIDDLNSVNAIKSPFFILILLFPMYPKCYCTQFS